MKFYKNNFIPIALIILSFVIGICLYPQVPDQIPTHWGPSGHADAYGSKFFGLFLFPAVLVFVYVLFLVIPKIDPLKKNIFRFMDYYLGMRFLIMLFMFLIYIGTIAQIYRPFNMNYLVMPLISVLFYILGDIMPHMKRNWFMGIRTPWTLSSDRVWEKTHKVGGKLFKLIALVMLLGLVFKEYMVWIILISVLGMTIFLFAYSYWLWSKEK